MIKVKIKKKSLEEQSSFNFIEKVRNFISGKPGGISDYLDKINYYSKEAEKELSDDLKKIIDNGAYDKDSKFGNSEDERRKKAFEYFTNKLNELKKQNLTSLNWKDVYQKFQYNLPQLLIPRALDYLYVQKLENQQRQQVEKELLQFDWWREYSKNRKTIKGLSTNAATQNQSNVSTATQSNKKLVTTADKEQIADYVRFYSKKSQLPAEEVQKVIDALINSKRLFFEKKIKEQNIIQPAGVIGPGRGQTPDAAFNEFVASISKKTGLDKEKVAKILNLMYADKKISYTQITEKKFMEKMNRLAGIKK